MHLCVSRDGSDARMRINAVNLICSKSLFVPDPPILHDILLPFQVRDNDCERYITPTQNLVKHLIGSSRCFSDSPPSDAKEEEIDPTNSVEMLRAGEPSRWRP